MFKIPGSIPITIQPFFWIVAGLIGWLNTGSIQGAVIWALIIFVSVLVHEFGHALSAIAFGQKASIELMGFGGMTYRRGDLTSRWKDFIIVLCGPLAGFMLGLLAWWAESALLTSSSHSILTYVLLVTFYVNVFWTFVNLLPIQPMDGGKLLSIFLEWIFGTTGLKLSYLISIVLAAALGIFLMIIGQYLAASLFFLFTFESFQAWKEIRSLQRPDQDPILLERLHRVEKYMRTRDHRQTEKERELQAIHELEGILNETHKGILHIKATELLAEMLSDTGHAEQAFTLLNAEKDRISPHAFSLLQLLAFKLHRWEDIIKIGDKVYQEHPNYHAALTNAIAHAMMGQVRPAVGWLKCAVQEGAPNVRGVAELGEFDKIRQDPLFQQFLAEHKE